MLNFAQHLLLLCIPFFLAYPPLFAQEPGCGTVISDHTRELLSRDNEALQRHTQQWLVGNEVGPRALLRLPIQAYRTNRSSGSGGISESTLTQAITLLNQHFAPIGVEFYPCAPTIAINDDQYFNFSSSREALMTEQYFVPNTINIYFVNSIDGGSTAGYAYLPHGPDVLVIGNQFATTSTFPHEMGHFFGLYHTHGKSNCDQTDELVSGLNCLTAGDDVCDTPADPNLAGPNCRERLTDEQCNYRGNLTDAEGNRYAPDVSNLMSYAPGNCRTRFSPGQLARMDYYLRNVRNYFLGCDGAATCAPVVINQSAGGYSYLEWSWNFQGNTTPFNFRYRQQGQSTWTTIADWSSNNLTLLGLRPCTTYEYQIQRLCPAAGKNTEWSPLATLKTAGCADPYCYSYGTTAGDFITQVQVGNLNNRSGDNHGYGNFTEHNIAATGGQSLNFTLTPSPGPQQLRGQSVQWQIFVDLNQNNSFDDPGERIVQGSGQNNQSFSATWLVPTSVVAGKTRLRIVLARTASGPCTVGNAREVEDYSITIGGNGPMASCLTPGLADLSAQAITANGAILSTRATPGATYTWRYRLAGTSTWITPAVTTVPNMPLTGLQPQNSYEYQSQIRCSQEQLSAWSPSAVFSTLGTTILSASPSQLDLSAPAGTQVLTITANTNWSLAGLPTWLTAVALNGTGNATVNLVYSANTAATARNAILALSGGGQTLNLRITQSGAPTLVVTPGTAEVSANASSLSLNVAANLAWTAASNASWATLNPSAGNGNGVIGINVAANTQPLARNATITVAGGGLTRTLNISQGPAVAVCATPNSSQLVARSSATGTATLECQLTGGVTSYFWRYRSSGSSRWINLATTAASSQTIIGLIPGGTYEFQCRLRCASNGLLTGWSLPIAFTIPVAPVVCEAPSTNNLTENTIAVTSARLSCAGPSYSSYQWRYRLSGQSSWNNSTTTSATIELRNLSAASTYEWQLQGVCSGQVLTEWSSQRTFTTLCPNPTAIVASSVSASGARLGCTAPGAVAWQWQYRPVGTGSWQSLRSTASTVDLTGLLSNRSYEYQVQAQCSNGSWSTWTSGTNFTTLGDNTACPVPLELTSSNLTTSSARIGVAANSNNGFQWRYRKMGTSSWFTLNTAANNYVDLSGLTAATVYEFQVQMHCGNGVYSGWSASKEFQTTAAAASCTTPSIADLRGEFTENGLALLSVGSGIAAASFAWRYRLVFTNTWVSLPTTTQPQATINGLVSEAYYEFQVRLLCPDGTWTRWSATKMITSSPSAAPVDLSWNSLQEQLSVDLFPNPTTGEVTLVITGGKEQPGEIELIDVQGKVLLQKTVVFTNDYREEFDLGNQPPGLFLVRVRTERHWLVKRLVKK